MRVRVCMCACVLVCVCVRVCVLLDACVTISQVVKCCFSQLSSVVVCVCVGGGLGTGVNVITFCELPLKGFEKPLCT